ncbi:MAG: hypothetical protein IKT27_02430, partial [Clostridia bacterium]|nr:hypothetical protein [Clostridia bacterium]
LILKAISLGGGGVFRTPLTSQNNRHRTHKNAFYGNPQSNKNSSSFAFINNNLLLKNNHFSQSGDFSLQGGEK